MGGQWCHVPYMLTENVTWYTWWCHTLVDVPQEEQLLFSGTGRVKSLHHSCVEGGQDSKVPWEEVLLWCTGQQTNELLCLLMEIICDMPHSTPSQTWWLKGFMFWKVCCNPPYSFYVTLATSNSKVRSSLPLAANGSKDGMNVGYKNSGLR
jgi:hypothetical protein